MPSTPLIRPRDLDDMDPAEADFPYASASYEMECEDSSSDCSSASSTPRAFPTSLLLLPGKDLPFTTFEDHVLEPVGCITSKTPSGEATSFWSNMDHLVKLDYEEMLSPISFA